MIIPARPSDIIEIHNIMKASIPECWSVSSLEEYLNRTIVFVDEDSSLCGFIIYSEVLGEGEILELAVSPEKRRNKIGTQLLDFFFDLCRAHNISSVFLEVRSKNHPALSLYSQYGFKVVSKRKNYYHNPDDDAIIMNFLLN